MILRSGSLRSGWAASAVLLVLALCLGGGPGWLGERLLAIPALFLAAGAILAAHGRAGGSTVVSPRLLYLPPLLLLWLPALQRVPLPFSLWSQLPGREPLVAALGAAGVTPGWMPWSVAPFETETVLESLLVPVAIYMSALVAGGAWRYRLLLVVLWFGAASGMLGLWQVFQGPGSATYFYLYSNRGDPVGLFANRNHLASLMATLLPVAAGLLADHRRRHPHAGLRDLRVWLLTGLMVLATVVATATHSRGVFLLLMLSVGASAIVLWRGRPRTVDWGFSEHTLRYGAVFAVVLIAQYTLYALLARLQQDPLDDLRWSFAGNALQAAAAARGTGFGLGSFAHVYEQIGEAAAGSQYYVNHAHNDYVELWLEGGIPALLCVVAALVGLVWLLRRQWLAQSHPELMLAPTEASHRGVLLGAGCALLLMAAHSAIDYPLRTMALQCWAAVLAAVLVSSMRPAAAAPAAAAPAASTPQVTQPASR